MDIVHSCKQINTVRLQCNGCLEIIYYSSGVKPQSDTANKCCLFFFIKLNVLKAFPTKSVDLDSSELDPYWFPLSFHRLIYSRQLKQTTFSVVFFQALHGLSRLLLLITE